MQIPISAANWYPLSASYPYDVNTSLQPVLIQWKDGYRLFHHPIFEKTRDVDINNSSILYLTSALSYFDAFSEIPYPDEYFGSYAFLQIGGSYIDNINNELFATGVSATSASFYRIVYNIDNTYSFVNGDNRYITVDRYLPYGLTTEPPAGLDDLDTQRFTILRYGELLQISTVINNPYDVGPVVIERYWSYSPISSAVRAIGVVEDDDYTTNNPFLINASSYDMIYTLTGMQRDHTWVKYYNTVENIENNKNVELLSTHCISGLNINRLVDLPYEMHITMNNQTKTGDMQVNVANLKNYLTPEYENYLRTFGKLK